MDKKSESSKWEWLPAAMPGVARLIAEKRKALGNAHVNECWKRGVIEQKPDWFYAREGALAVGIPFTDAELAESALPTVTRTQAILVLRNLEPK